MNNRKFQNKMLKFVGKCWCIFILWLNYFFLVLFTRNQHLLRLQRSIYIQKSRFCRNYIFCKIQAFKCCDLVKLFSKPIFEFFGNHHDLQPHPPPMWINTISTSFSKIELLLNTFLIGRKCLVICFVNCVRSFTNTKKRRKN